MDNVHEAINQSIVGGILTPVLTHEEVNYRITMQ